MIQTDHPHRITKPIQSLLNYFQFSFIHQIDLNDRRSRRDMSPQGRKRATAMVARDFRTVSGIGQSYHNNNQVVVNTNHFRLGRI